MAAEFLQHHKALMDLKADLEFVCEKVSFADLSLFIPPLGSSEWEQVDIAWLQQHQAKHLRHHWVTLGSG